MPDKIEALQFAAFLHAQPPFSAHEVWAKSFPSISLAGFRTLAPNNTLAEGLADGMAITLQVQPNRIDAVIKPVPSSSVAPDPLPDVERARALGEAAIISLLPDVFLGRAAAVVSSHALAKDASEAIDKMRAVLPGMKLPGGTIDCTHQITVQYNSDIVPNRKISQLLKWQTVQSGIFEFALPVDISAMPMKPQGGVQFALLQMIDVFGAELEVFRSDEEKVAHFEEVSS